MNCRVKASIALEVEFKIRGVRSRDEAELEVQQRIEDLDLRGMRIISVEAVDGLSAEFISDFEEEF